MFSLQEAQKHARSPDGRAAHKAFSVSSALIHYFILKYAFIYYSNDLLIFLLHSVLCAAAAAAASRLLSASHSLLFLLFISIGAAGSSQTTYARNYALSSFWFRSTDFLVLRAQPKTHSQHSHKHTRSICHQILNSISKSEEYSCFYMVARIIIIMHVAEKKREQHEKWNKSMHIAYT